MKRQDLLDQIDRYPEYQLSYHYTLYIRMPETTIIFIINNLISVGAVQKLRYLFGVVRMPGTKIPSCLNDTFCIYSQEGDEGFDLPA